MLTPGTQRNPPSPRPRHAFATPLSSLRDSSSRQTALYSPLPPPNTDRSKGCWRALSPRAMKCTVIGTSPLGP
jgi:hypothetical protein